ncbi:MAG: NAD(P)H-quinone oxidoreductase [Thermaerobacter sp.]|nr:NAD(P)H-quinone oxidoreductase [Thermaerobacter sp.]
MRAISLKEFGGPDVLRLREVPKPRPGPDEVLIRVESAGVNRADLLERQGLYPPPGPRRAHQIPGLECAGVIEAAGDAVTTLRVGDRAMALLPGGGYAEFAVAHERLVLPVPASMSSLAAGGVPEVFLTAFDALFDKAGVAMGDRVLVHAGASGVGSAAIQLAKAAGARVVTTVGSQSKRDAALRFGADYAVVYRDESWPAAVRAWSDGEGVSAILDFVGRDYLADNVGALSPGGCLVIIGTLSGSESSLNLGRVLSQRLSIRGTALRSRPLEDKMRLVQAFRRRALPGAERGDWAPVVDRVFALRDAAQAHQYMATNANIGKIILRCAE